MLARRQNRFPKVYPDRRERAIDEQRQDERRYAQYATTNRPNDNGPCARLSNGNDRSKRTTGSNSPPQALSRVKKALRL
jgi:hypothetical protein